MASGSSLTLPAILFLALILRVAAALQPGFHHPDAIFQYLEPAHRLLTGEGVVTWEWRVGMRGWLIPWLFAAPMWLGRVLAPGSGLDLLLPRLLAAVASLSIVWSAWTIGARRSSLHATLAAATMAVWFEAVHFGVQTMAEPLACAALFSAAALLTERERTRGQSVLSGFLLGIALLARPQYAPVAAILALTPFVPSEVEGRVPSATLWSRVSTSLDTNGLRWITLGGLAALTLGALADLAAGATPLAWVAEYVRQNIVVGKAAQFGTSPAYAYLGWWGVIWRWSLVPIALGVVGGRRIAPVLFWAALACLALHSAIGHKEYRFVLFATLALVMLSSLGWAELLSRLPRHRRAAAVAGVAAIALGSLVLGTTGAGAELAARGRAGTTLFQVIARDPAACGVAVAGADFAEVPGMSALRPDQPLLAFLAQDPTLRPDTPARARSAYNRLVAPADYSLPPGYMRGQCLPRGEGAPLCVFARPGHCAGRSQFAINASLARAQR